MAIGQINTNRIALISRPVAQHRSSARAREDDTWRRTFPQSRSQSLEKVRSTQFEVDPGVTAKHPSHSILETIPASEDKGNQFPQSCVPSQNDARPRRSDGRGPDDGECVDGTGSDVGVDHRIDD